MPGSIRSLPDEYLESDELKALIAMVSILSNRVGPWPPGSAFLLLHRPMSLVSMPAGDVNDPRRQVLRGSTGLGERNLPYDVVFILNDFFAEMAAALSATGGRYSNFTGDGLMSLYGLEGGFEDACRNALPGA